MSSIYSIHIYVIQFTFQNLHLKNLAYLRNRNSKFASSLLRMSAIVEWGRGNNPHHVGNSSQVSHMGDRNFPESAFVGS